MCIYLNTKCPTFSGSVRRIWTGGYLLYTSVEKNRPENSVVREERMEKVAAHFQVPEDQVKKVQNFSKQQEQREEHTEHMLVPAKELRFQYNYIIKVYPNGQGMDDYGNNVTILLELPKQHERLNMNKTYPIRLRVSIQVYCAGGEIIKGEAEIDGVMNDNDERYRLNDNRIFRFNRPLSIEMARRCLVDDTLYFAVTAT